MTQSNTTELTPDQRDKVKQYFNTRMNSLLKSSDSNDINRLKQALDKQVIRNNDGNSKTFTLHTTLSDPAKSKLNQQANIIKYTNEDIIRLKRALNAPMTYITQDEHIQTATHRDIKRKLKTPENSNLYGYGKYLDKQNNILQQKLQEELKITANLLKEISALTKAEQNNVYKKINQHIKMTDTSITNAFDKIDKKYFTQRRMSKQDMQTFINKTLEKYNEKTITSKHYNIREDIANLKKLNKTITAIKNNWII